MIKKIVVATDFSESAAVGVSWAMEIAKAHGASMRLVHSLHLTPQATPYLPPPPDLTQEVQKIVTEKLTKAAAEIAAKGVEVTANLRHDEPATAIADEARDYGADVVVLGTHGTGVLEHLLLGSTAERVIARTHCPVLTVPTGSTDHPERAHKILVPTDFSDEAKLSAETAIELLGGPERGELVLVHVCHLPLEFGAYGEMLAVSDYMEEVTRSAQQELAEWSHKLEGLGWTVATEVDQGIPSVVIRKLADKHGVDVIAMGTHGRTGLKQVLLGSTAKRVLQHANCPTLTVRRVPETADD